MREKGRLLSALGLEGWRRTSPRSKPLTRILHFIAVITSRPGGARLQSIWLFLQLVIWPRKPKNIAIGFPWISLDSLVRIVTYQWVTMDFPELIFHAPFPLETGREREPADQWHAEGQNDS